MLTSIPPLLLHRIRDAAAYVHDLAQLGLALLCPCEDDHGAGGRWLLEDENGCPAGEHLAVDCPGDACRRAAA